MRILALIIAMFLGNALLKAQSDSVLISETKGVYHEEFYCLKSNKSLKHGEYALYYKNQLIEKGVYVNNKKVGLWRFYSFNNILEFEYDYTTHTISRLAGDLDHVDLSIQTPCLFQGSPLVPYIFMVSNLSYPKDAVDKELSGRVVLTLKIDKRGRIYGFYISEKLNSILDHAVMETARQMPDEWRFLPATRSGKPLVSEYNIAIEFEL